MAMLLPSGSKLPPPDASQVIPPVLPERAVRTCPFVGALLICIFASLTASSAIYAWATGVPFQVPVPIVPTEVICVWAA